MQLARLVFRVSGHSFVRSSALGIVLLAARIGWMRELRYGFLLWNLFLAWVPFGCAFVLRELARRNAPRPALGLVFLVWLGFLPNAPYLVTDFIHLRYRGSAPLWFDAVMLASFAWAGVGLGVASLRICSNLVRARLGPWLTGTFVILTGTATGFGIYLGRFVRLNTWDVAARPSVVFEHTLSPLVHPLEHSRAWIVTVIFALFYFAVYGVQGGTMLERRGRPCEE